MLEKLEEKLSEDMIKKFHFILRDGTLSDSEKEWFNVGEYKKRKNFVGNIKTTLPDNVEKEMIEKIIEFHVRFKKIIHFKMVMDVLVE